MTRVGVYAGSFDPLTLGHVNVIQQARLVFDKVVVLVCNSAAKGPRFVHKHLSVQHVNDTFITHDGVEGDFVPDCSDESAAHYARRAYGDDAHVTMIRGLRGPADLEQEVALEAANWFLADLHTVYFVTASHRHVSSSAVRALCALNREEALAVLPQYVPPFVLDAICEKKGWDRA